MGPLRRSVGLVVAAVSTMLLAVTFVALAVLSLASGHGQFSWQVALMLLLWGVLVGAIGWGLWTRQAWSRGAAVATGLLHVLAFGQLALTAPAATLGSALGLATLVSVLLPGTTAELRRRS